MSTGVSFPELVARARSLTSGPRRILGIAGPPGSGKSTVAEGLVRELGNAAALVPMDGFHLAGEELLRLGRQSRKGAPDTFDASGYLALLRRLRTSTDATVYCPRFDRTLEEPIAGAIPISRDVPLVVTEGNYLLLEDPGWAGVRATMDEVWFVHVADDVRRRQLIERHVRFGRTRAAAEEWVHRSDERNAGLVARTAASADVVVDIAALMRSGWAPSHPEPLL